ncbi:MAG: hypothetical protein HQK49_15445 [Oligoflexia bacterium]|nr:hypothetical protein [Oligoflexia bacterium]
MLQEGLTIIFSTHDIDLAYCWADTAYILQSGKVVASCSNHDFNFTDVFSKITSYGFIPPKVIELSTQLKKLGIIPRDSNDPRSLSEIIQIIKG